MCYGFFVKSWGGIEMLIVLTMAPFHFSIMPRGKWLDQLMHYTMPLHMNLKQGRFLPASCKAVRKFRAHYRPKCIQSAQGRPFTRHSRNWQRNRYCALKGLYKTPLEILVRPYTKKMLYNNLNAFLIGRGYKFLSTCSLWPG